MKLEVMRFAGQPVGLEVTAESDEDRRVLWALRGLKAEVSETFGMQMPQALFLCPKLPWENVPDTLPDADA